MNIKEIITRRGMTQGEFAKLLGVSPAEVSNWVNGKRNIPPSMKKLIKYITGEGVT